MRPALCHLALAVLLLFPTARVAGGGARPSRANAPGANEWYAQDVLAESAHGERRFTNVAKEAKTSSTSAPGLDASRAVDGVDMAWYSEAAALVAVARGGAKKGKGAAPKKGSLVSIAQTLVEDNPFLIVDLGQVHRIHAVEVWTPLRDCDAFGKDGPLTSKCVEMVVSPDVPLVVDLLLSDDDAPVAHHHFPHTQPVYSWDNVGVPARHVLITLPGTGRQLTVTEVKVFVEQGAAAPCSPASCFNGECTCVDAACETQVCRCKPDYAGEDCSTPLLRAWRYLPLRHRLPSPEWAPELFHKVQEDIHAVQHPAASCQGASVHPHVVGAKGRGAGFASTLHYVSGVLSDAYEQSRPLILSGVINYAGSQFCQSRQLFGELDCFFRPLVGGACERVKEDAKRKYKPPRVNPSAPNRCVLGPMCNSLAPWRHVPPRLSHMGLFWYRTVFVDYLMRVTEEVQGMLQLAALKQKMGYEHPIIGVHVRHGDACHTTIRKGTCKGLAYYLPELRALASKYNTTRVYLATDDTAIIEEAGRYAGEFTFVHADVNRSIFASKNQIEYRFDLWSASHNRGLDIMMATLVDLFLLADADAFVGHFLSNMSRLALEMAAARKQRIPPYISKDGPWCPVWKMCV
eukprot:jgi/Mesvir1/17609/Mv08836-RA.1